MLPVAQFEIGAQRNFVYLVFDLHARAAAIVDPQRDLAPLLDAMKRHALRLTHVLLTHTHFDHVAGAPELARLFPDVPIVVHPEDAHRLSPGLHKHVQNASDGQILKIGSLELEVLHTPGHSAGECCFLGRRGRQPFLFTGDTVFIRDCGRTDLESGSTTQMFETLQRLRKLPPETVILPGHHYQPERTSTLRKELRESPPFQCRSVAELEALP